MENQALEICVSELINSNNSKYNNFAKIIEEEDIIESPPESLIQTASTCLISFPVFECIAQEWQLESPVQEWVEFESFKSVEGTNNSPIISKFHLMQRENTNLNLANKHCASANLDELNREYKYTDDKTARCFNDDRERKSLDKLKRRKGMYLELADWDVPCEALRNTYTANSSKSENDLKASLKNVKSNTRDNDDHGRYYKRPLRGPYGQMLEAEMMKLKKQTFEDSKHGSSEDDGNSQQQHKCHRGERNIPQYTSSMRLQKTNNILNQQQHIRSSSIPLQVINSNNWSNDINMMEMKSTHSDCSKNELQKLLTYTSTANNDIASNINNDNKVIRTHDFADVKLKEQLLAELLKGSSEKLLYEQRHEMFTDTRTHVVQEIFKNEQSYVESLQTLVFKYLGLLKSPEYAGMIDLRTVDEIFFMVPDILAIHEKFLAEFKYRLDTWDPMQKVGDVFMETFSKLEVLEIYTSFVNNCNRAKNAIRTTKQQRPSFAKFLETTAREHKGKLSLDNLLIKPVQKFPNYEMLFQRLMKHTDSEHPDQKHLQDVLKLVHDILVHINCKERDIMENDKREAILRELEFVIEGTTELCSADRNFLLFDLVSMHSGHGASKERGIFLFNDLLILTSVKKRSGTIRKPNPFCPSAVSNTLETNKYKFLTKISLECLEIVHTGRDECTKPKSPEMENLEEDLNKLHKIIEIVISLKNPHQYLEDAVRELQREVQKQLSDGLQGGAPINVLNLNVVSSSGNQKLSILFGLAERRILWKKTITEAKQKIVSSIDKHQMPEFLMSIPIRKTRAGLQFTCAAPTLSTKRDVWVCNSDGYVGQVCIMSLDPEPNVTSCNGVCNARILCLASIPAFEATDVDINRQSNSCSKIQTSLRKSHNIVENDKTKKATSWSNSGNLTVNQIKKNDRESDLNLSSSEEEPDTIATNLIHSHDISGTNSEPGKTDADSTLHVHQNSYFEDYDKGQSTMWIGTEDGCIHIYNSTDNIRIKKNRIKIELNSAVYSILYIRNRVFASLANGNVCVYSREGSSWNTNYSHCLSIGSASSPVMKLLDVQGSVWCSIQGTIKVLELETYTVIKQTQISADFKPITNMTHFKEYVWISIQNSAHIKCFHYLSHQLIAEVNLAPVVNKMLSNCDEIIRQHKAACLRVTSLLFCKGLIWIGTSAGVLLTIPAQEYEKGPNNITASCVPHGHTGHVRFLSFVEISPMVSSNIQGNGTNENANTPNNRHENKNKRSPQSRKRSKLGSEKTEILVISGGDGYEDFRNSGVNSLSEVAGREDSTNHLLIWKI